MNNIESECSVLGWLMLDDDLFSYAKSILEPTYFYADKHRYVFEVMIAIKADKGHLDLPSVVHSLRGTGKLIDVGGSTYLAQLARIPTNKRHFEYHCLEILRAWLKRQMIAKAIDISKEPNEEHITELLKLSSAIQKTRANKTFNFSTDLADHVSRFIDSPKKESPLDIGFRGIDSIIGGLRGGDLFTVAGRPGSGKTAFLVKIASNVADKLPALYFPTEMTCEQFVNRVLTFRANVDSWRFRKGEYTTDDYAKINESCDAMNTRLQLTSVDNPNPSLADIRSAIDNINPKVVIIDYLQRCNKPKAENVTRMTDAFMTGLKTILIETNTIGIIGCQLNRRVDKTGADDHPSMADLRDSGSIEHESDQICILHSPDMLSQDAHRNIDAFILKNRHGRLGVAYLSLDKRFVNMNERANNENADERIQPKSE